MKEEKNAMQQLIDHAAPLARRILEEPAMMERLKATSPWFTEETLRENLRDILEMESKEEENGSAE